MTAPKSCRFCGSEELERSDHKGELTCCRCGAVLEESGIVEGLQFAESAGGGIAMVGRFVPAGGTGRSFGFGSETREQALQRGLSNIQAVADRLRLSAQHVASAHRLYLMASQRNFSAGRRGVVVAGACLYAICRRERTPHLLIDFSDVLRVSVRSLGQVFMRLLRLLHVQVPQVDPSLFMDRFAAQLNLGLKTRQVAQTAVRLVQAMARDWISTGRRPVGLCGAALLVAARYHDIQIDAEEVATVVRISCPTLSKRLSEFKRTAVAQLPASALEETDLMQLPTLSLPPCRLVKKRHKPQQQQQQLQDSHSRQSLPAEERRQLLICFGSEWNAPLPLKDGEAAPSASAGDAPEGEAGAAGERAAATAAAAAASEEGAPPAAPPEEASEASSPGQEQRRQPRGCSEALCKEFPSSGDILSVAGWMVEAINAAPLDTAAADAAATTAAPEAAAAAEAAARVEAPAASETGGTAASDRSAASGAADDGDATRRRTADVSAAGAAATGVAAAAVGLDGDADEGQEEEQTFEAGESDNPLADLLRSVRARADELLPPTEVQGTQSSGVSSSSQGGGASLPSAAGSAPAAAAGRGGGEGEEDVEALDDSDDEGLQDMLLSQQEREAKALIWDDLTRDVMPEVHRRLRERKLKEKEQRDNPNKRRRSQAKRTAALEAAASAAESVRLSLEKRAKGLAQRIDEEALEALFAARKVVEL